MNPRGCFLRRVIPIAAILLACVLSMPSRAEIGSTGETVPSGSNLPSVHFAASTEDPDPVPWGSFSSVGSGRIVLRLLSDANVDGRSAVVPDVNYLPPPCCLTGKCYQYPGVPPRLIPTHQACRRE